MSLLLDARKKSQQAQSSQSTDGGHSGHELSLEEHPDMASGKYDPRPFAASPDDIARNTGKNLFNAKSPAASASRKGGINRNLLFALGGTVLLLAAGAGYLWYLDSGSSPPLRARAPRAAAPAAPAPSATAVAPEKKLVAETNAPASVESTKKARLASAAPRKKMKSTPKSRGRVSIKPQTEQLDPLIGNAYLAYRAGKFNEARQMYLEVLGKDARNIDALLGLGAIAQELGEDRSAAQYYMSALALDPRNAVAHAGMSELSANENSESRLKNLLREQRDSAALHFALGNIYAGQSRWSEAQAAYFNAYTLDAKNAELAFNLAVSLDHLGQVKLAVQFYQRALQLDVAGGTQPHRSSLDHAKISQRVKELTR